MSHPTPRPAQPIRLHGLRLSGHSHRAELFLSLLGLPYEFVEVDFMGGEHKSPRFLGMNLFGQVPVIEDGAFVLPDSAAILVYLARSYGEPHWLPAAPREAAEVQRWLSVAAGQLAYGAAAARLVVLFGATFNPQEVAGRANGLLKVMEQTLGRGDWLTGSAAPTIADIALYSYTLTAPEGNVSLVDYPHVRAWLARVEALPGFLPMPRSPVGLPA